MRSKSIVPAKPPTPSVVLVIDDNHSVARALEALLSRAGFSAVICGTGADALKHSQTPAAVVLDIHLPDINGLILAPKLRDRFGPDVPIVIVSGDTSMETLNSLAHVGATYFFSKPINAKSLMAQLKALIGDR